MPRADSNAAQAGSNAAQAGSNAAVADGNAAQADGNAANEGQPVQQQPVGHEQARSQREFMRGMPRFDLGDRFDLHMERFTVLIGLYQNLDVNFTKLALYSSLQNNAFKLVSPEFNPSNSAYLKLSFQEFADILSEVFEPSAEREAAKIEFEQRSQVRGEHPILYFRDKINLFLKGYPKETRDYSYFYNRVIANLLNAEMRDYLRLNIPIKLEETHVFRGSMIKIANIVRRKYLDGEISEEMAVGAECFSTNNSYMESDKGSNGRTEAIFAIRNDKTKIGPCYYCTQYGHLKAQCARKANGLPPVVAQVDPLQPQVAQVDPAQPQQAIEALYANRFSNKRFRPVKPFQKPAYNAHKQGMPTQKKGKDKRFNKRRVMYVYEQPDGQLFCEPINDEGSEHEHPVDQDVQEVADRVEAVALDAQAQEVGSDYIPSTFLGLGM